MVGIESCPPHAESSTTTSRRARLEMQESGGDGDSKKRGPEVCAASSTTFSRVEAIRRPRNQLAPPPDTFIVAYQIGRESDREHVPLRLQARAQKAAGRTPPFGPATGTPGNFSVRVPEALPSGRGCTSRTAPLRHAEPRSRPGQTAPEPPVGGTTEIERLTWTLSPQREDGEVCDTAGKSKITPRPPPQRRGDAPAFYTGCMKISAPPALPSPSAAATMSTIRACT